MFTEIFPEKFLDLEKEFTIQVQGAHRTPNGHDQERKHPRHIVVRISGTKQKERIIQSVSEK